MLCHISKFTLFLDIQDFNFNLMYIRLYRYTISPYKVSTCKTSFKQIWQKNVPANNCHLKILNQYYCYDIQVQINVAAQILKQNATRKFSHLWLRTGPLFLTCSQKRSVQHPKLVGLMSLNVSSKHATSLKLYETGNSNLVESE